MHQHEVEAAAPEGRRIDVALAQVDPGEAEALQVGAGHRQHRVAGVEPGGAGGAGAEQAEHPPGAGAEIDEGPDRAGAEDVEDRRLDGGLRHVQRAQAVPLRRQPGEEALRRLGALGPDGIEARAVLRQGRRRAVEAGEERGDEVGRALDEAEERPGALAVALDEARLDHQLEVARDPRLRLAEDVGEVGDRQLALAEKGQDAQARLLRRRAQHAQGITEGDRSRHRLTHSLET